MQELRINVEVSPKLAISQSQNQAKLYVHRGYEDHGWPPRLLLKNIWRKMGVARGNRPAARHSQTL